METGTSDPSTRRRLRTPAYRKIAALLTILSLLVAQFALIPAALAGGGAYSLKWYGADPDLNAGTYMPTYVKKYPTGAGSQVCPTPSGGTGRARTEESFAGPSVTTYDGRALAIVRPTGAGRIAVTVEAPGLAPAVVELDVLG